MDLDRHAQTFPERFWALGNKEETMTRALLRLARVLVAQAIAWGIAEFGGITIPQVNITIGAALNAIFKFIRDKYPTNKILEWIPL